MSAKKSFSSEGRRGVEGNANYGGWRRSKPTGVEAERQLRKTWEDEELPGSDEEGVVWLSARLKGLANDIAKLDEKVAADQQVIEKFVKVEEEAKQTLNDHKEQIDKVQAQARSDKLQAIQILAVFVAFFTFVSVEFQLFAVLKDPLSVVALTSVLLGALLCFVLLVVGLTRKDNYDFRGDPFVWIACVLLLFGVGGFVGAKHLLRSDEVAHDGQCKTWSEVVVDKEKDEKIRDTALQLFVASCQDTGVGK